MNRRTILFVMTADTPDHQISDAAEAATAAQDHLICLILGASPALPMYAYGVPPYGGMKIPDNWTELVTEAQKQQRDRVQEVETLLAKSNASGDVQSAMCVTMDIKHRVAQAARVCDEAYLAASLRDTPEILREAASGILFHSPIGFRLNGSPSQKPKRVFVAWDSSEAASRAAHAWLSHHGCKVTVSQFPSGGREVGQCIQDRAREVGADLVVMGAYGHARMIQTVFGGTTRSMVEQLDLPVLLAH
jgi:nucleotide-binding universal stress UspA family protein